MLERFIHGEYPIIDLDLGREVLRGWESPKSQQVVDALILGIEMGDNIPPALFAASDFRDCSPVKACAVWE